MVAEVHDTINCESELVTFVITRSAPPIFFTRIVSILLVKLPTLPKVDCNESAENTGNKNARLDVTPEPIVTLLNARITELLRTPDMRQRMGAATEISAGTPRELGDFVVREIDKWKRVVAQAKLEVE